MSSEQIRRVPATTALNRRRRAEGLCVDCGQPAENRRSKCRAHLDKDNSKKKQRVLDGLCRCGRREPLPGLKYCGQCQQMHKCISRALKVEVINRYGGSCQCCGEAILEFLTIDHIGGGGNKQRREVGWGRLYHWLRKNNYPDGYRVLCIQCNFGRAQNGGICPHETERANLLVKLARCALP